MLRKRKREKEREREREREREGEGEREREKTKGVTGVRYIYTPLPARACTRVRQNHAAVSPSCRASSSSMMIRRLSSLISPPLAAHPPARSRSRPVSCQMRKERRMGGDDLRSPSLSFLSLCSPFLRSSFHQWILFFFLFFFFDCLTI